MNKAKQLCGMPFNREPDQVVVMYPLLQPQNSGSELEPLKAGELLVVREQDLWQTVKIISKCLEGKEERKGGL